MEVLRKVDANDFFKVVGIFSSLALGNVILYKGLKKLTKDSVSPSNSKEDVKEEIINTNCFLDKAESVVYSATVWGTGAAVVASVYSAFNKVSPQVNEWEY